MLTKAALIDHLRTLQLAPGRVHYHPCSHPSTWRAFRVAERAGAIELVRNYSYPHFKVKARS